MIIYGWAQKILKTGSLPNQKCQVCDHDQLNIIVTGSYFNVFWIPVFPYAKKLRIVCPNCSNSLKPKEATTEITAFVQNLKKSVRMPWYLYSGALLILLSIGYFAVDSYFANQEYEDYLNNPEVSDVYTLYDDDEPSEYKYYFGKVVGIENDSIWVSFTSFKYNYNPTQLDEEDGFYDVYYTYHKNELLDLFENDEIRSVKRSYDSKTGFDQEIEYVEDSTAIQ